MKVGSLDPPAFHGIGSREGPWSPGGIAEGLTWRAEIIRGPIICVPERKHETFMRTGTVELSSARIPISLWRGDRPYRGREREPAAQPGPGGSQSVRDADLLVSGPDRG